MKILNKEPFASNGFFQLQDQNFLIKQRKAGKIASSILTHLEELVKNKTSLSMIELNSIAEEMIIKENAIPTFKNYNGFPSALCVSINTQLVHGIPSDYHLQDGDLVTFDIGVTYEGAIADTAITCIYGQPKSVMHSKLVEITYEALCKSISMIKVDSHLGIIGSSIYKTVKGKGFSVITKYGGHGIGMDECGNGILHGNPFVENKSESDKGIRIQPGLVIAIEPLIVIGNSSRTFSDKNGTVYCDDICCHFEHTIFVHKDSVEIITKRDNENTI